MQAGMHIAPDRHHNDQVGVEAQLTHTAPDLQAYFTDKCSSKTQSAVFVAVRIALVLLIALVAAGVPGFGLFIALIGSLACASLSFIIPALCHLVLFRTDINW